MRLLRAAAYFGILALFAAGHCFPQAPFGSSCAEDLHIDAAEKKTIDSRAMDFIQTVLRANPAPAYDLMSHQGQAAMNREQFIGTATGIVKQFQPKRLAVQHAYLIELIGRSPGRVVCATDLSKPDGWESVATADVSKQAYVVLSADAHNNKLAFTIWMVPEGYDWKIQSFHLNVSSLADKDSMQLWQMAHAEQARQRNLNAALLYVAAAQTAERGPNLQLGLTQSISADMAKLTVPPDVRGQPPFLWKDGETTYKVASIGPIAVGGKIYVNIVHEVSPWQSNDQVDGWNKQLLRYFKGHYPEYSEVFAGLVVRAMERGSNRGYGTVEEVSPKK